MRSKVVCTWSSTMGYELIGHNKLCIFMDPNGENSSFVPSDKLHKPVRVQATRNLKENFIFVKKIKINFSK